MPRIFAPFVLLLPVLACLPGLRNGPRLNRGMVGTAAAGFVAMLGAGLLHMASIAAALWRRRRCRARLWNSQ